MDEFMKENLEDHLAGMLAGERKRAFESHLAKHPQLAEELAQYEESASLFDALRPDGEQDEFPSLAPGFYNRVKQEIDQERGEPFWMVFLEPFLIRRLAFASLMWLALLGSYIAVTQGPDPNDPQVTARILMQSPTPEYRVRLGSDLERNRNSMLSVMLASR